MKRRMPRWMRLAAVLLAVVAVWWIVERRGQERQLFDAAAAGDAETVRALLNRGIRVDARERRDAAQGPRTSGVYWAIRWSTPLHYAAFSGGGELVDLLIGAGADVNATSLGGHTPLMLAAEWQEAAVVRRLLAAGAAPDVQEQSQGNSALHMAGARGDVAILKVLLDAGAEMDVANVQGATPLCKAAENRHAAAAELLLKRGATTHVLEGRPPLYVAAQSGDLGMARLLLKYGADPREEHNGNTPRQSALANSYWRMARLLQGAEAASPRGAGPARQPPARWRQPRAGVVHWEEFAERMALSAVLPLAVAVLHGWLLRRMWREDGLLWLKRSEAYLPLRGRWLRLLLTAVLVVLGVPLCAYNCLLLFLFYEWLASRSYQG